MTIIWYYSLDNSELKQFHAHKYWKQVNLDVDRSHRRFPAGKSVIFDCLSVFSFHLGTWQCSFSKICINPTYIVRTSLPGVCKLQGKSAWSLDNANKAGVGWGGLCPSIIQESLINKRSLNTQLKIFRKMLQSWVEKHTKLQGCNSDRRPGVYCHVSLMLNKTEGKQGYRKRNVRDHSEKSPVQYLKNIGLVIE